MINRLPKVLLGAGALLLVLIAAALIYLNFVRADAPAAFELQATDVEAAGDATTPAVVVDPTGTWTVGPGSEAGYRVVEDIAGGLQNFEAVGRTSEVSGSVTIEGTTVTAAEVVVELESVTSDDRNRDSQFRGRIMNVAEFPTARFVLDGSIELGFVPDNRITIGVETAGDLTLRDVTRAVPVTIDAQILDDRLEVVGSIPVVFSDFEIDNPSVERIVSVRDQGLIEFRLLLRR